MRRGICRLERAVHGLVEHRPRIRSCLVRFYQTLLWPVPVRERGGDELVVHPGFFFGFVDKCPWRRDGGRALAHRVNGRGWRAPSGPIEVGTIAPSLPGSFRALDRTRTWNWQQGAELQWRGAFPEIVFNVESPAGPVGRVVDEEGSCLTILDRPVAAVSPDGESYASFDFRRLARGMPGYGYEGWGEEGSACVLSLASFEAPRHRTGLFQGAGQVRDGYAFLSHASFSPDGKRLAFFYRNRFPSGRLLTRTLIADLIAEDVHELELEDCSHFAWLDSEFLFAFCRAPGESWGYAKISTTTGTPESVAFLSGLPDGHPGTCKRHDLIVSDTYPDRHRLQRLLLFALDDGRVEELLRLRIPLQFRGTARCDFHPRWSPDGRTVCFDSAHLGARAMCFLELEPDSLTSPRGAMAAGQR